MTKKMPDLTEQQQANQAKWTRVRELLRAKLGEDIFTSWFARLELENITADTVHMTVPTRFLRSWIQSHYAEELLECWQAIAPEVVRIDVGMRSAVVRQATTAPVKPAEPRREPRAENSYEGRTPAFAAPAAGQQYDALGGSPLDPRLTFDTFVVGRSNTLAQAAARQVANARRCDPVMFNPLYIHSGVGLGKTHLLQSITWAGNTAGDRKVMYLTAEKFVYGFVSALRSHNALAFKDILRGIDVLVIDDLQFLQGKQTQAEFSHTLNSLIDAGRQVVVAADRPPSDMESLDERVRSRLAGGLVVEMGGLGEELRLEILNARVASVKCVHSGFNVPQEVLTFIARSVTNNGRDLEGALNRLIATSTLTGEQVTMELAEREVRDLIRPPDQRKIKIEDIQRIVARHYNVSRSDLLSSRRTANVVRPRQVAMYLAKTMTLRSLPEIGRRFGGRDHTTVLHAVRKIEHLVGNDATLADEIESLKRELQE